MNTTANNHTRTLDRIIEDQIKRWNAERKAAQSDKTPLPIITFSRQCGVGGYAVAKTIAENFHIDLFDKEIIQQIAESSHTRTEVIQTLDERGVSSLEDMLLAVTEHRHLWAYDYLQHLIYVVGTIAKHGRAVIVGRGANFILPRDQTLKVRIIAPLAMKINTIMQEKNLARKEAEKLITKTDADKEAFIRKYFNADINDAAHYDLVINREIFDTPMTTEIIKATMKQKMYVERITPPRVGIDSTKAPLAGASI